ncbi:sigma factor-like helix-turn-helix DNA-binding protein [Clostridium intestinale]|uniref:RNA polymerase sigma-70 region 4 domain-containing protein n=1 Tax=Clostridium intestinale URNW TaxID=1294142 RepID=U2N494_9CLOT|nr:sigma factor-like helix-turn-helix DNA-binding protein [Clostridium intestinale]ERK30327.1 hypothetical protein CINTURNW_2278 [Clostridium intestinale URNW]
MKEYIELGNWYSITENASKDYLELIKINKDGKVDIDHIRVIYSSDRSSFFKLINEILLRGGSFHLEKEQNILKNITIESNEFIFKSQNEFRSLEIDFGEYNIGDFLNKYKVDNDKFFNFMFIEAFKVIDRNVNIGKLKDEFIKVGFKILKKETFERKYIDKINEKGNAINEGEEDKETDNEYLILEELNNILTSIPEDIKYKEVKVIFIESNERMFIDYCIKNDILLINDLDGKSLYKFSKFKGIGKKKFDLVKEKLKNIQEIIPAFESKKGEKYDYVMETKPEKYLEEIEELDLLNVNIEDIFNQRGFLVYCFQNNKMRLKDILVDIETGFIRIPNMGVKKCKRLFNELDELIEATKSKNNFLEDFIIKINEHWFKKIKSKKIKEIALLLEINLNLNGIAEKTFEEIQNTKLNDYSLDNESKKEFVDVIWKINNLMDINSIIEASINILKDDDKKILNQRYLLGNTLEEIGKEYNLTRERIRQRILKSNEKLMRMYKNYDIISSLKLEFINSKFIGISELLNFVNEQNRSGIKIFLELREDLIFKDMEILILNNDEYIEELNNEIIEYLDEEFIIDDVIDRLNEIYEIVGFKDLEKYIIEKHLIKLGYRKYGKLYSKNALSLQKGYEWIANRYIENSIRIDDEVLNLLKKKYIEIFEEDISDKTRRTVEARIMENPNMICIDNSEYIHKTKWNVYDEAKMVADKVLEDTLKLVEITTAQDVMKYHESELLNVGIHNKYYFYSIIKHFFGDKYATGKGNTMSITYNTNKDIMSKSREVIVKEYISKNGGIVLRTEVLNELRWELFKLEDTISKSNEIIKIGKYITLISNELLTENIKSKFKDMVSESLSKYGVVSTQLIYSKAMIDIELYTFFKHFHIKSGEGIAAIIKFLDPNLKGHTNLLYYEYSKVKSPEDIVISKFREVHKKEEIKSLLKEIGYKEASIGNIFAKLIEEKEYYLISNIEIVYKDKLEEIEGNVINDIYSLLGSEIGEKAYIVVNNISRLRRRLPRINFTWEPELISSLVNGKKYRRVKRVYYDYVGVTDRVILVKDSSSIERFDELVKHIITNEYNGVNHIDYIYNFLVDQGVIYNNEKNKSLPYEILTSKLFEIDEMGRFKIKE